MITQDFLKSELAQSINYNSYRKLIDELLRQNLTTGEDNSPDMLEYARMNVQRMNRWDKTYVPSERLTRTIKNYQRKEYWLLITEGWCGDAAQNVPMINKFAEMNPAIQLRIVLRDQHLELIDKYLTNGTRSIPKLIRIDAETFEEIGIWGPRPAILQERVLQMKNELGLAKEEMALEIHLWYAKNKGQALEEEFMSMLEEPVNV